MGDQKEIPFGPPDPPTGPVVEPPPKSKNTLAAYRIWRESAEGLAVWRYVSEQALSMANGNAKRISTKTLVEAARLRMKLEINNSYTAYFADDLVVEYPQMLNLIERRRRSGARGLPV